MLIVSVQIRPQSLQAGLRQLAARWPADLVRPKSVSVRDYLEEQCRLAESSRAPSSSSEQHTQQQRPNATPPSIISQSSVAALTSLLNNRYARRYPLPKKFRYPASNPLYYDQVIQEFEEAPNRNWLGRILTRLSGLLRFR